jgi:superfamily II DNA helicase RecQ
MEDHDSVIQKKYGIELKRSSKGDWYISSLSINADTKEEFERAIDEAKEIANKKFSDVQEMGERMNEKLILERGREIVFGKLSKKQKKPVEPIKLNEGDQKLFEKLKIKRKEIADEKGFPPYIIAHDRTLARMALKKPKTKMEMLSVGGFGERKYEDYGEIFLKVMDGGEEV